MKSTAPTAGSDGSTASSWAMKECAHILKQRILEAAAANAPGRRRHQHGAGPDAPNPFKGLKAEDLDLQDGVVVADPGGASLARRPGNLFATYSVGRPGRTSAARRWIR